jgi:D-alanyl-D-alanine carboxypeptidase
MNRCIPLFTAVLLAASALSVRAQEKPEAPSAASPEPKVDAYVKAQMEKMRIPGLSLAVLREGKVVLSKGYGFANLEHSVPATPDTVYELGSITKQFTASAVMLLVEEGKLGLDDPISKHLSDLPASWSEVTVRHLLTHTSGIKSYTGLPSFQENGRKDYTHQELIKLVADLPIEFQPGEKWAYNNTGYFLLGMLIEKVTAKSYGDYLQERIFGPLQMTSTRVNDLRAVIKNRATGYDLDGGRFVNAEYISMTQPFAAGVLVSSVVDMAKWDAALYTDTPLKTAVREQMWTPAKLKDGSATSYGFGWSIHEQNKHRRVGHGGGIPGFTTSILRYPDDKLTVIVLTNQENAAPETVAKGIAGIYVPDLAEKEEAVAADPDTKTTEFLKNLTIALSKGLADPGLFTLEAQKILFPDKVKEAQAFLSKLGALKSFTFLRQRTEGTNRVIQYRATFGETQILMIYVVDKDGKVAGAGVRPG